MASKACLQSVSAIDPPAGMAGSQRTRLPVVLPQTQAPCKGIHLAGGFPLAGIFPFTPDKKGKSNDP
jgi:hypothetical protein